MTIDSIHAVVAALRGGFPDAEVRHFPDESDRGYSFRLDANGRSIGVLVVTFEFFDGIPPQEIERQFRMRDVARRLKLAGGEAAVLLAPTDVRVC
jgi:hypothetical protein